jgi:hypothetical protein
MKTFFRRHKFKLELIGFGFVLLLIMIDWDHLLG